MNLIEEGLRYVDSAAIDKASALVGESTASTHRALQMAARAIVAGLAGEASSITGAKDLRRVVEDAGLLGPPERVSEQLGAASGEDLVGMGKGMLGHLFGGRLGGITEASAMAAGVRPSSMSSLLALAAPLIFGALGSHVHTENLDAAGLAGLLGTQRNLAVRSLPSAVVAALPGAPEARPLPPIREVPVAAQSSTRALWPLLLLIPAALLVGLFIRNARAPVAPGRLGAGIAPEATEVTPPPVVAEPSEGTAPATPIGDQLAQFLATPGGPASKRFVFDHLNFAFATADLTPESLPTLDRVAKVLGAHPDTEVLVEGHTDGTGVPAANERLSLERANAVKAALIARGVPAEHVTAQGIGQGQPLASNDTEEGRARNRRTELVITRRCGWRRAGADPRSAHPGRKIDANAAPTAKMSAADATISPSPIRNARRLRRSGAASATRVHPPAKATAPGRNHGDSASAAEAGSSVPKSRKAARMATRERRWKNSASAATPISAASMTRRAAFRRTAPG